MSFLSLFEKKDKIALVFDIGSSSVGGALFVMQQSGIPKIIFSMREPIALETELDSTHLLDSTIKTLEIVAEKISIKGLGAPAQIFCVLASPWIASKTRIVKIKKDIPFMFTSKLGDSLIQKEIAIFEKEHAEAYKNAGDSYRPIEFKNMKTMLNGYATSHPLNQKATELEMNLFISVASEGIVKKIEAVLFRHFHAKEIKFSSFMMASFAVARDMFIHQDSFLLVDISGEATDISMIKKDMLHDSVSFSIGRNFILRGVAQGLHCTLEEARSYISLYKDGHANVSIEKMLEPIVTKLKSDWLLKFQESLANLSNDISIPATICITIDADFKDLFRDTIKNEQFNQYTLTESKFRVIFLDTEILHGIAAFTPEAIRDPFLIIESIYITHFLR